MNIDRTKIMQQARQLASAPSPSSDFMGFCRRVSEIFTPPPAPTALPPGARQWRRSQGEWIPTGRPHFTDLAP